MKKERNAKGQGCFIQQENGDFLYRKSVGVKADGKRKVLVVRAANKAACIKLMKEKEAEWEKEKNRLLVKENTVVEDLCRKHLDFQIKNNELKPTSEDRRDLTIRKHIGEYSIGRMQIQTVTAADIEEHVGELIQKEFSVSTIEKVVDVLNAAYEWAVARGDYSKNPVAPVKTSIKKRLKKLETKNESEADVIILSDEEVSKFLETACIKNANNGKYKYPGGLLGRLLLHTGMRAGEMICLTWDDYDRENGLLTINKNATTIKNRNKEDGDNSYTRNVGSTKNQKARVLQLTEEAKEVLELIWEGSKHRKGDDLICITRNGKPYTATMVEHCVGTVYKAAGLSEDVSGLHIFRRTFATRMYDQGAGAKEIAAYIGDLESTTLKYYIAARKDMKVGATTKKYVPLPSSKNNNAPVL